MTSYTGFNIGRDFNNFGRVNTHVGGEPRPPDAVADILIFTALPEEHEAARHASNGVTRWLPAEKDAPEPFLLGDFAGLTVALARPVRMGGRRTGASATSLAQYLKPRVLAMSGVCAGHPDRTALGDVIVADRTYEWDEGKLGPGGFQGDQEQYRLSDGLLRAVQEFDPADLTSYGAAGTREAVDWFLERLLAGRDPAGEPAVQRYFPSGTWRARLHRMESDGLIARPDGGRPELTKIGFDRITRTLYDNPDGPVKLPFVVVAGPIASGSAVIGRSGIWAYLADMGVRTVTGLDLEVATIASVADQQQIKHWLAVKGVMDHADQRKSDRFKRFAACASAEVLFALLERLAVNLR